jgi:alpha-ketoglutarate-dependent taurine dioxygenase
MSPICNVSASTVSGQQTYAGGPFPRVYACQGPCDADSVDGWIASHRDELLAACADVGAILFREFPLRTADDFDRFIRAFGLPNFPYKESLSNAVRINKTDRVFTANEAPPTVKIFLHHEMAQTPVYPSRLFFFCEHSAETGGATPLCRSDVLWKRLEAELPAFAADCRSKGLRYTNVMPSSNDPNSGMGRSWQSTLATSTRAEAEARLIKLNYSWQWLDNDELRVTTPRLPAVYDLPDGRSTFFNQLIAAFQGWKDDRNDPSKAITFGDGSPLDPSAVRLASQIADELSFDVPWQTGDVALIDNFVTMHGRRPFTGTRKVLASLVACD